MSVKMTQRQLIDLWREEELEIDGVRYTLTETGEWEQDYKMQSRDIIFTDGERFYRGYITRSGSPFTDWEYEDYGDADIEVVRKVSVTIEQWRAVN